MSEGNDRDLIGRVRSEPAALAELYGRHVGRVIAFAARRCREPQDAADIVAGTFVELLDSAHTYDPVRGDVLPWILGIESRLIADLHRGARREGQILARSLGRRPLDDDEFDRLEEQLDAARVGGAVGQALGRLDESEREALLLAGHDLLSSREAAAVLGISSTAFRMRLSRARRALARQLERDQQGERIAAAATIGEEP